MVCIHVPVLESNAAEKNNAKSRCFSAASAPPDSASRMPAAERRRQRRSPGKTTGTPLPNACSFDAVTLVAVVVPGQRSLFASGEVGVDPDAALGTPRARRHQLGRRLPWPSARRRRRARRRHRRGAVAVRSAVHVRPLGRRPAPVLPTSSLRSWATRARSPTPSSPRCAPGWPRATASPSGRPRATTTATGATASRPTATASCATPTTRSSRSLTLGATRPFRLRPHGRSGGPTHDIAPGSGDVLVMGGACQRDWEHGVPKVRSAGPRVSVTWRWVRRPG